LRLRVRGHQYRIEDRHRHDATAVTFFALDKLSGRALLLILDWDIACSNRRGPAGDLAADGIGAVEELSRLCGARHGSVGVWIEDNNSGTILLQQAVLRQWPATAIDSKLTAMGKDERALSVSGYVYRGSVKYTDYALDKTTVHKRKSRNHLSTKSKAFRIGDKDNKREDDLLDTFCYGIAIGLVKQRRILKNSSLRPRIADGVIGTSGN
jgi:hypothetical protein